MPSRTLTDVSVNVKATAQWKDGEGDVLTDGNSSWKQEP